MRVCYFGTYDRGNHRNDIILAGLRANGVEVVECHTGLWESTEDKVESVKGGFLHLTLLKRVLRVYIDLLSKYRQVGRYDVMVVGHTGHFDVFVAKPLSMLAHRPLVFDLHISLHGTIVEDRKLVEPGSLFARLIYAVDKYACLLADMVLLDTEAHIKHFGSKFGIETSKFRRLFVGANDVHYQPLPRTEANDVFKVLYYGKYIPLHGVEYIVQAARELAEYTDIRFEFVGAGQVYPQARALASEFGLSNIKWIEWLPPEQLVHRIGDADVCLGIFGTSPKAGLVVPSKVYVGLAMKKAVVTGDSPAVREILSHSENVLLCRMGDGDALAREILRLRNDPLLCQKIASNGYKLFRQQFSSQAIGQCAKDYFLALLQPASLPVN
jgi:glycosyltransferase involved in cell wall biosynthesis